MKTPKYKLPKARVMWADNGFTSLERVPLLRINTASGETKEVNQSVAILPRHTRKQAAAIVKFANMTEEERRKNIIEIVSRTDISPSEKATLVLNTLWG